MERKPEIDALRAALLRLAVAHNRAVLAGFSIATGAAVLLAGTSFAFAAQAGPLSAAGAAAALAIGWKGVRLQRHAIHDLGAGRAAAADAAALLLERGGRMPLDGFEAALGRDRAGRALAFLGPLGLARTEGAPPVVVIDRARLEPLLADGAPSG